jgi:hypothetical protein
LQIVDFRFLFESEIYNPWPAALRRIRQGGLKSEMTDWGPALPETRVAAFVHIRRERTLPVRGEVSATIGSKLDPLDSIARAVPPKARRALSLTRVLGVREAEVPRRLLKQVGDAVAPREIIISKPINFGLQQLVYRAPGAGQIVAIKGSWMVLDLDGAPVDLKALYRGTVSSVTPGVGAVVEGQGALMQGVWGSGKEGYGVLKVMTKTPEQALDAEPLDVDVRGTILVAGIGATEEALRRAESLQAQGLIVGSLEAGLRGLAEKLELPIIVTEGFGRVPMSAPIFNLLSECNGQEAAVNGVTRPRGGAQRPEIFIPRVNGRLADRSVPGEWSKDSPVAQPWTPNAGPGPRDVPHALALTPLVVQPGAPVRVIREPYLGRTGVLPQELFVKWTGEEAEARLPSVEVELNDARGTERAIIPWTNLELIG